MLGKHSKIFISFYFILFVILVSLFYIEYRSTQSLKKDIIYNESKSIAHLVKSFRQAYQKKFIENHIKITSKTLELLPVRTMKDVSEQYSSMLNNRINIRTVAANPRDILNKANTEEMALIESFKKDKSKNTFLKVENNAGYIYAEPLYMKKQCINCHGKREEVIETVRNLYDTGYNYQAGDIYGILVVDYKNNDFIQKLDFIYYRQRFVVSLVFLLVIGATFLLFRTIRKKDNRYQLALEEKNIELQRISTTDHLTGLLNRTAYAKQISRELNRSKRENKYIVYAMFDLDNFKKYNDTYGHQNGDVLLQNLGKILKESFKRSSDSLFRLGGEEFLAVYSVDNIEDASIGAEKARKNIYDENVLHVGNQPYGRVTTSVGIAIAPPDMEANDQKLYANADIALYESKESGKNCITIFKEQI